MATGVNYWSSYEPIHKVRDSVWGGAELDSGSEDGGGGVTQDTPTMEVRGQLILVSGQDSGPDRKHRAQRLVELQERRRGLQTLLGTRLAELRRICLQEAELTGLLPADFPLEAGEKPPCVRRRGGSSRQTNRKSRPELEESQQSKPLKTLFSSVRKHSDPEHNTQLQSQRTKRTVHRGCHTDDAVRSESSSTSDSTGHDHDDCVSQCRPPLVTTGSSPVEVFSQNKLRNPSLHNKNRGADSQDVPHRPSPPHPPPPPPRSQDGSTSSGQTDPEPGRAGGNRGGRTGAAGNSARRSNSSDGLLDRGPSTDEDGLWVNGLTSSRGGALRSSETDAGTVRTTNGPEPCRGRAPYSDLLLDYVWTKQQQMFQRQQSHGSRQPITSLYPNQRSTVAPPTYRGLHGDRQRIKVTRTKSCGPFLPVQSPGAENFDSQHAPVQPDPHPQLLPPRPPLSQDSPTEEATRSLHKALALEGLRDWYLRNTLGPSHQTQTNGNVSSKTNRIKGRRRTTHGVIHHHSSSHNAPLFQDSSSHNAPLFQDSSSHNAPLFQDSSSHNAPLFQDSSSHNAPLFQDSSSHNALLFQDSSSHNAPLFQDSSSHNAPLHQSNFQDVNHNRPSHKKAAMPHSATFHGLSLHGRSMDRSLYDDSFPLHKPDVPLRQTSCDQPSPGTLV